MAQMLESFDWGKDGYDWDKWCDGRIWHLREGSDYRKAGKLQQACKYQASKRKLSLLFQSVPGGVVIQFVEGDQNWICASSRKGSHCGSNTRLYKIWGKMKERCYNPNCFKYRRYGGRGIMVCPEWRNDFPTFRDWALANGYAENMTIDRINNDGNYEPSNCQWLTHLENSTKRDLVVNQQVVFTPEDKLKIAKSLLTEEN